MAIDINELTTEQLKELDARIKAVNKVEEIKSQITSHIDNAIKGMAALDSISREVRAEYLTLSMDPKPVDDVIGLLSVKSTSLNTTKNVSIGPK